jgi:DNA-binding transcriptional LysR family regulator
MRSIATRHAYKEIRLQQLRSLCETARLGSLTAAAASLGLAQPTVWEQVHALEREFTAKLITRRAHGCRLTDVGRMVVEFAAPLVAGVDSLKRTVQEARRDAVTWLTLAATQRMLVEDVSEAITEFDRNHPHIRLRLVEMRIEQITPAVESGEADLGLTVERGTDPARPRLVFEPVYELDQILVTPKDHPLARRRRVGPKDLLGFPIINAPAGFADPATGAALQKLGAFNTQPRRVEAFYTAVIRRYVELGFGIGLVVGLPSRGPSKTLHERSMGRHFGRVPLHLVWRKGALQEERGRAFAQTIRASLNQRGSSRSSHERRG